MPPSVFGDPPPAGRYDRLFSLVRQQAVTRRQEAAFQPERVVSPMVARDLQRQAIRSLGAVPLSETPYDPRVSR